MFMSTSCLCASGEDLVPEQTSQREEDEQEEAATFPAGLHDDPHPTRAQLTRRRPPSQQPRRQQPHADGHKVRGILSGLRLKCK